MRSLGLLVSSRGVSCEFYRSSINRVLGQEAGGEHAAPLLTINCPDSDELLAEEKWGTLAESLKNYSKKLAAGGAEGVLLGSVTWYRFLTEIARGLPIPVLHPLDAMEIEFSRREISADVAIGVIGSSLAAFPGALIDRMRSPARRVVVPRGDDACELDRLIAAINNGTIHRTAARHNVLRVIHDLRTAGAFVVVVESEELASVLNDEDCTGGCFSLPTVQAHVAVDWMLSSRPNLQR